MSLNVAYKSFISNYYSQFVQIDISKCSKEYSADDFDKISRCLDVTYFISEGFQDYKYGQELYSISCVLNKEAAFIDGNPDNIPIYGLKKEHWYAELINDIELVENALREGYVKDPSNINLDQIRDIEWTIKEKLSRLSSNPYYNKT